MRVYGIPPIKWGIWISFFSILDLYSSTSASYVAKVWLNLDHIYIKLIKQQSMVKLVRSYLDYNYVSEYH